MKVTHLEQSVVDGRIRLSCRFTWEDRATPARTLWYDFPPEFADDLSLTPNVFLPVALGTALRDGEQRVLVDGGACPRLLEGLDIAALLIASWFPRVTPPTIATTGQPVPAYPRGTRAAMCISGGVDSLAALRANRDSVPPDHPAFVRDGIFYFGLNTYDFDGEVPRPERLTEFHRWFAKLELFGERVGIRIIPIATNARTFAATWDEWDIGGLTPSVVGGAHALSSRVRSLAIAGAGNGIDEPQHGYHPLLDGNFSSFGLGVHTVDANTRRYEKVERIARWPEALATLRVCLLFDVPTNGFPNCGTCEKCVRTKLELLANGVLDQASTFPTRDVTPEMVRHINTTIAVPDMFVRSRNRLAEMGRHDLVSAIDDLLAPVERKKSLVERLLRR
jgi:hypothetical protein